MDLAGSGLPNNPPSYTQLIWVCWNIRIIGYTHSLCGICFNHNMLTETSKDDKRKSTSKIKIRASSLSFSQIILYIDY